MHPDHPLAGTDRILQPGENIFAAGYPFCRFGVKERRQAGPCCEEEEENIVENDPQKIDFYNATNVKVNG